MSTCVPLQSNVAREGIRRVQSVIPPVVAGQPSLLVSFPSLARHSQSPRPLPQTNSFLARLYLFLSLSRSHSVDGQTAAEPVQALSLVSLLGPLVYIYIYLNERKLAAKISVRINRNRSASSQESSVRKNWTGIPEGRNKHKPGSSSRVRKLGYSESIRAQCQ